MSELGKTKDLIAGGARFAYTAVITEAGDVRLGIAVEGEQGYNPVRKDSDAGGTFESYESAQKVAAVYNARLGLEPDEAMKIVFSTMKETKA